MKKTKFMYIARFTFLIYNFLLPIIYIEKFFNKGNLIITAIWCILFLFTMCCLHEYLNLSIKTNDKHMKNIYLINHMLSENQIEEAKLLIENIKQTQEYKDYIYYNGDYFNGE